MFKKSKGVLLSFLALAAILPVLLAGMLSSQGVRFLSKADSNELRIWLEPSQVTAKVGQKISFKVVASYDESSKTIPGLEFLVKSDQQLDLENAEVIYSEGFNGRKVVGKVELTVLSSGVSKVWIDEASINSGLPNLTVMTTGSEITVRN